MDEKWVDRLGIGLTVCQVAAVGVALFFLWWNGAARIRYAAMELAGLSWLICWWKTRELRKYHDFEVSRALRVGVIAACAVLVALFCAAKALNW